MKSKYIIVVFRSRHQTLSFAKKIKDKNLDVRVINTPYEIKIGCGLSARIEIPDYDAAKKVVRSSNYPAFVGFYNVRYEGTDVIVDKIYSTSKSTKD